MKAITKSKYGGPQVLSIQEHEIPSIEAHQVLVKIAANSINAADWRIMRGQPFMARLAFGLFAPKQPILGCDFAGEVVAVGEKVSRLQKGDYVFGESLKGGAFAQFLAVDEKVCAQMLDHSKCLEYAALPLAGLTAYQALVTNGKIKKGETVLINGASGSVGHLAVQIATILGAKVTAVCSARNAAFVKSVGAQSVIAHDQENIHEHTHQYDLVIDVHGNLQHADFVRMGTRGVLVGFTTFSNLIKVMAKNAVSSFKLNQFTAQPNATDLAQLAHLMENKGLQPTIEKVYKYNQVVAAMEHEEQSKNRGKIALTWA